MDTITIDQDKLIGVYINRSYFKLTEAPIIKRIREATPLFTLGRIAPRRPGDYNIYMKSLQFQFHNIDFAEIKPHFEMKFVIELESCCWVITFKGASLYRQDALNLHFKAYKQEIDEVPLGNKGASILLYKR